MESVICFVSEVYNFKHFDPQIAEILRRQTHAYEKTYQY